MNVLTQCSQSSEHSRGLAGLGFLFPAGVFFHMHTPFDDINIPFRIANLYQGLGEIEGRLRAHEGVLLLEYRMKDAVLGVLRSRVKELRIPFDDIEDIEFHNGWFRKRITVRARGLRSFADIPGAEGGTLVLVVARRDAARALAGIARVRLLQSEQRLRALDNWSPE